ncbi:MAG TPA: YgiT-type zinc finger protein [Desulfotomaculum sp.]|nr:YgiT-type zinc finger protein [Desulfotomaculum sp.]
MTECKLCGGKVTFQRVDVQRGWGDRLVIIPGVPAYVCGQCGEQYFDADVALEMDRIKKATGVPGERIIQVPLRPYTAEARGWEGFACSCGFLQYCQNGGPFEVFTAQDRSLEKYKRLGAGPRSNGHL